MKPAPFKYFDPTNLAEAVHLRANVEDSRALAGGQSLMPMMNFRFVQPSAIIDLNNVAELRGLTASADSLTFGAMTRQRDILQNSQLEQVAPVFREALRHVGHRQTRARGTIGGSLSHFDPSAELCNLAALHDATFRLESKSGSRTLSFEEFGLGYLTTAVGPEEILCSIQMRRWPAGHAAAFEEFALRHGDFALCAVSCLLLPDASGIVSELALCISGLEPVPVRMTAFERSAVGMRPGRPLALEAARAAERLDAMSDAYVSGAYRKHLARVLTYRCVARACEQLANENGG